MDKRIKIWSIILISLFLVFVVFAIIKKRRDIAAIKDQKPEVPGDLKTKKLNLIDNNFPIELGNIGIQVLYLQAWLNNEHSAGLVMDGNFGPKTLEAYKSLVYFPISGFTGRKVTDEFYVIYIKPKEGQLKRYINYKGITF